VLLDAIAVGQATPGPVFTTATFIGYLLKGGVGALSATIGIFLPAFLFVVTLHPFLPRLKNLPAFRSFLDGVILASLGLLTAVGIKLGYAVVVKPLPLILFLASLFLILRMKINSFWLILGGLGVGALHLI
jgi:chromate transporter